MQGVRDEIALHEGPYGVGQMLGHTFHKRREDINANPEEVVRIAPVDPKIADHPLNGGGLRLRLRRPPPGDRSGRMKTRTTPLINTAAAVA